MAILNPWVFYIGVPIILLIILIPFKRKSKYKEGKKVANTSLLEETDYFKKLYKEYKILSLLGAASFVVAMIMGWFMLARPARVDTVSPEIHNRDIMLCMDISNSVDELNLDICDELKTVVEELDGECFGITIFNGQAVLLVPLTNDYQYVLDSLDALKASFEASMDLDADFSSYFYNDYDAKAYHYKFEGTLAEEGSSFIGDGLASALYNFPDLEKNNDRSRMIIFTTDNELNGEPYVTVEEAAELCKKNDVKVFGIAPENIVDENAFKTAMRSTGGGYYRATSSKAYKELVEDIKKTETSLSGIKQTETRITDQPESLFVWMMICVGVYFVISKKIKL